MSPRHTSCDIVTYIFETWPLGVDSSHPTLRTGKAVSCRRTRSDSVLLSVWRDSRQERSRFAREFALRIAKFCAAAEQVTDLTFAAVPCVHKQRNDTCEFPILTARVHMHEKRFIGPPITSNTQCLHKRICTFMT